MIQVLVFIALCWLIGSRLCLETSRDGQRFPIVPTAIVQAGTIFLMVGTATNTMCRLGLSVRNSLQLCAVGLLVLLMLLHRYGRGPQSSTSQPSRWTDLIWGLAAVSLGAFTNLCNNRLGDDDVWIHAPLQALLARGGLPLLHPFFSDIPMNGHYGRDLAIAITAWLCDLDVLRSAGWHTCLMQLITLSSLWLTVYAHSGLKQDRHRQASAWLACAWAFLGINVGGRYGLIDTYQNNNACAYAYVALILFWFGQILRYPNWRNASVCGLLLGGFAVVYETHFGLLMLSMFATVLFRREQLVAKFVAISLGLALLVAVFQGGPITSLVTRHLGTHSRSYTEGEMNQHQIVTIRFPKRDLFKIKLGPGLYQRVSFAWDAFNCPRWMYPQVHQDLNYYSIWEWEVLKIHWLTTWCTPLVILWLLRSKDPIAFTFCCFGCLAYLTPGLVDFGPIYESEYFRWQFAAGFGFSVSLAIGLSHYVEFFLTRFHTQKVLSLMSILVASCLIFLCLAPNLCLFMPATAREFRWTWLIPLSPANWLENQASFRFTPTDLEMAKYISRNSQADHRILTNFSDYGPHAILWECMLVGLTGVRCVGHALPVTGEPVGTTPYHMAPAARAFWAQPSRTQLNQLRVHWILLQPNPPISEAARKWFEGPNVILKHSAGDLHLYEYKLAHNDQPPTQTFADWPVPTLPKFKSAEIEDVVVEGQPCIHHHDAPRFTLGRGESHIARIRGRHSQHPVRYRFRAASGETPTNHDEVWVDLEPGRSFPLVAPLGHGLYRLEMQSRTRATNLYVSRYNYYVP